MFLIQGRINLKVSEARAELAVGRTARAEVGVRPAKKNRSSRLLMGQKCWTDPDGRK